MTTATASETRTALIIGATGSFGAHAAQALIKHGWAVRALSRNAKAARGASPRSPIDWVQGDAMVAADVLAAARGAQLIVHAGNPPRYHNWKGTILPMAGNAMAAAIATGARLMIPGNVYNFGPNMGPEIREDAPQLPATRKGAIRAEVERRLREASAERGLKVLILRAGDFFGPAAPNSGLSWLVTRRGARMTGVYRPGPDNVGHAFAYLPDLAETMARLMDAEARMDAYAVFHFKGHWVARNGELGAAIRRVAGDPCLPIKAFPWPVVWLASPVVEMFRELWEMRYLWRRPIGLSNARLVAFLGAEPHTPLDTALRASLSDMGLLEERPASKPGLLPLPVV
jgi:nucleoside-diphosphate-sugar epimerase